MNAHDPRPVPSLSDLITPGSADLLDAAAWAFEHVYYQDHANACMHTSQVRYSPLTFRLAETLARANCTSEAIRAVLAHRGLYAEDRGRAADDGPV